MRKVNCFLVFAALIQLIAGSACLKKTMQFEVVSAPPPAPLIKSITTNADAAKVIQPGQFLEITVEGTPDCAALVSMGSDISDKALSEDKSTPGTYRGRFEIPSSYLGSYTVAATLSSERAGETEQNGPEIRVEIPKVEPPPLRPERFDPARITSNLGLVFFEFDHHDLRDDSRASLEASVRSLEEKKVFERPDSWLVLEGHCDEVGSEEYNENLGRYRAESVRDFLVNAGLPAGRLITASWGRRCPREPVGSEAEPNRRVKLRLVSITPGDASGPWPNTICPPEVP